MVSLTRVYHPLGLLFPVDSSLPFPNELLNDSPENLRNMTGNDASF